MIIFLYYFFYVLWSLGKVLGWRSSQDWTDLNSCHLQYLYVKYDLLPKRSKFNEFVIDSKMAHRSKVFDCITKRQKSVLHHRHETFLHQSWLIFFPSGTYQFKDYCYINISQKKYLNIMLDGVQKFNFKHSKKILIVVRKLWKKFKYS
jgi:hypothetical protein